MARPEYPTSIRLTLIDKRRLRKQAEKSKRSLAGLIQTILMQWLEKQEQMIKPEYTPEEQRRVDAGGEPRSYSFRLFSRS